MRLKSIAPQLKGAIPDGVRRALREHLTELRRIEVEGLVTIATEGDFRHRQGRVAAFDDMIRHIDTWSP